MSQYDNKFSAVIVSQYETKFHFLVRVNNFVINTFIWGFGFQIFRIFGFGFRFFGSKPESKPVNPKNPNPNLNSKISCPSGPIFNIIYKLNCRIMRQKCFNIPKMTICQKSLRFKVCFLRSLRL